MAIAQSVTIPTVTFYLDPDVNPLSQQRAEVLTVNSPTPATGITVTPSPAASWLSAPATIDHGTPFTLALVPVNIARFHGVPSKQPARGGQPLHTTTLTLAKALYDDLLIVVEIRLRGGWNPE
jgi:hypothetical protein